VDVFYLLPHHLLARNLLRVAAFLPQLKFAIRFMPGFAKAELI
jgi:hypothetical protein